MTLYEIILFLGLAGAVIAGANAPKIGAALKLLDDPTAEVHKKHLKAVPQVGSVLMLIGLLALSLGAWFFGRALEFLPIVGSAALVGFLGIVDDRLKLSWGIRLVALWSIVGALLLMSPNLLVVELNWSWGTITPLGIYWGAGFTALCLVGLIIALNMMDGFNGGILSQAIVWALIFAALAPGDLVPVFNYLAILFAVILSFNIFSRLFMGDGGAYALGLLMGAAAILIYGLETAGAVYADTIVVWLALPVFDCLRVIFRRKLRGDSPFLPQRDHMHHLLMNAFGRHAALVFAVLYTSIGGWAAYLWPNKSWVIVLCQIAVMLVTVYGISRVRQDPKLAASS